MAEQSNTRPTLRVLGSRIEDLPQPQSPVDGEATVVSAHSVAAAPLTDEEVLDTLVTNNGIVPRAAAILGLTEAQVMGIVSRNLASLSTKLRGRVMLSSFVTVIKLDAVLQASADELPLDTLGRTYAASLAAFGNLAGQFEEKQTTDDTDDAEAAKEGMLERLARMGKREAAERAVMNEHTEAVG